MPRHHANVKLKPAHLITCQSCKYFVQLPSEGLPAAIGKCYRYPPAAGYRLERGKWVAIITRPEVGPSEYACGEYEKAVELTGTKQVPGIEASKLSGYTGEKLKNGN